MKQYISFPACVAEEDGWDIAFIIELANVCLVIGIVIGNGIKWFLYTVRFEDPLNQN